LDPLKSIHKTSFQLQEAAEKKSELGTFGEVRTIGFEKPSQRGIAVHVQGGHDTPFG